MTNLTATIKRPHGTAKADPETFHSKSAVVVRELQEATFEVIALVCAHAQVPPMTALALSKHLGIDKSLAWRMSRFADGADPFGASKHLPGDAGLKIFVTAVAQAIAPEQGTVRLKTAIQSLQEMVRMHAGTRAAWNAMLSHCTEEPQSDNRLLEFRKAAFVANSAIFGIEAQTRLMIGLLTPGKASTVDAALVSGFLGIKRLRHEVSWPLARRRLSGEHGATRQASVTPLAPGVSETSPTVLEEYSTIRGDELEKMTTDFGPWYDLPPGDIGRAAAADCIFGERFTSVASLPKSGVVETAEVMTRVDLPVHQLMMEVLIERTLPFHSSVLASQFGLMSGGDGERNSARERHRMPMTEVVEELPVDARSCNNEIFARHWELLHDSIRWLDRRPADFKRFRITVRFPVIPSAVVLSVPLGQI